jgi:hypothetical protein
VADYTVRKAVTRLSLVRWALFQYLIGNADAHGKNVSFFCRPDGLALAPSYDLVSLVQYDSLDHELAMAYGDEFLLEEIGPFEWADFAQRTGIPRALLAREMRRMAKAACADAPAQGRRSSVCGARADFCRTHRLLRPGPGNEIARSGHADDEDRRSVVGLACSTLRTLIARGSGSLQPAIHASRR